MTIQVLTPETRPEFQAQIVALEQFASYPWGDDWFKIDHGPDYFAFFDRLGTVDYYVALTPEDQVAAVGAGILRQSRPSAAHSPQPAWYLCDLKVHPQSQHRRLSLSLLRRAIALGQPRCDRGYSISMDPAPNQPSQWIRILQKLPILPFRYSCTLNIYSLDAETMEALQPMLSKHLGRLGYRSLWGKKDLRLQSTGELLPLLHLEWGDALNDGDNLLWHPQAEHLHLLCAPSSGAIAEKMAAGNIQPSGTATVVSRGMEDWDWSCIMTSEI